MHKKIETDESFKAGFVAVIGRPNVGKSTLVNALLGDKVSIVSPKPQTTRTRIYGILNEPTSQLILVDTPGFCEERGPLTRALRRIAGGAPADADLTLVMAEIRGPTAEITDADREVLEAARRGSGKIVLALNKIDLLRQKETLLPWIDLYAKTYDLVAVIPTSARYQDGLGALYDEMLKHLPASPALFPQDMHTDQAERVLCAELVREQLLYQTQQEVPHSAAVVVDVFEDRREEPSPMCYLEGRIYVERESQKAIVIGRGGHQIKALGEKSRAQIEQLLGCKVFLKLTVHVDKEWTKNERSLRRLGLMPEMHS